VRGEERENITALLGFAESWLRYQSLRDEVASIVITIRER